PPLEPSQSPDNEAVIVRPSGFKTSGDWNDAVNYFSSTGSVDTAPVLRSTTRIAWLFVSAMNSLSPQPERPLGSWKRGFAPSSRPFLPSPRKVFTARVLGSMVLILWL